MADALASDHPILCALGKLTCGLYRSPDYSWRVGAESEERVGEALRALPPEWAVRHDIMIGEEWNADHVLVGPPGLFVVDTKFRSAAVKRTRSGIRVAGRATDIVERTKDQARTISARFRELGLPRWVEPVVVFDNEVKGARQPDGLHVVSLNDLIKYLVRLPRELNEAELQRLRAALWDEATWPFERTHGAKRASASARLPQRSVGSGALAVLAVLAALVALWSASSRKPRTESVSRRSSGPPPAAPTVVDSVESTGEESRAVQAIRKRYQEIGLAQWKLTKRTLEVPADGSQTTLVTYADGRTLAKAEWVGDGSRGRWRHEMTYFQNRLEFLFEQRALGATTQRERRFYLVDGRIVWATEGTDRKPLGVDEIVAAQPEVVALGLRALKLARSVDQKPD